MDREDHACGRCEDVERIWRAARRAAEQARDDDRVDETRSLAEEAEGENWRRRERREKPTIQCRGSDGSDKNKTKLACILEANESTRMRMGNSEPHNHEDHIAGKGENSLQHHNLVHKFIPMPQAMKIPAAKAAVDKECENWRKFRPGT